MDRRSFLKRPAFLFAPALLGAQRMAAGNSAYAPLRRFKLGAISDGFSQEFEEALRVMKSYGLAWVEIRKVYGIYNTEASAAQIRHLKDLLDKYQFRVSVVDSALFKCTLPRTQPVSGEKDAYPYKEQFELLKRASDRAHALGTDKIRGFTFWRVAAPERLEERIAAELHKVSEAAKREGMRLVIENEESCNAATGRELAGLLKKVPASNLGVNWDVGNGFWAGEASFPDGYGALDKRRVWHLHLKGVRCGAGFKSCSETLAGEGQNDLARQFRRLLQDGYQETMSLECEVKAPGLTQLETSRRSLEGLLKLMSAAEDSVQG